MIQGHAWLWAGDRELGYNFWLAYLGVLNSPLFEALLDHFCRRTQGGQYELAQQFLKNIPLPDLTRTNSRVNRRLAEFGLAFVEGSRVPLRSLDAAVASVYGVSVEDFVSSFPITAATQLEIDFHELASKWKHETAGISSIAQKMDHPAMRRILDMGESVVPFILRELRDRPTWWFSALIKLTGENPVPRDQRGQLRESANAWIRWGREYGYTI